jgi:imidazolonepropionase-like amidohydrolase
MDIYNTEYTQAEGKKNGVLEEMLKKDQDIADLQRENFRKAHRAGAKMVYGTDAGIYPHGQNARQFRWMVRYGMTPIEAIRSATANAAEALGRSDVGVVEAGRHADLIAVKGDPLADVTVLENVAAVIKGGEIVKVP